MEKTAKEWFRRKAFNLHASSWSLVVLGQAFQEIKAKGPTVFCEGKYFWKGIQKTLHGIETWEEVYLLAEVVLQGMSSALMCS